jgi:PncC family amidohydrolase
MEKLLPIAQTIAARLIERRETVALAEGSAGGLISAALLSVPGASAYFLGSAVVYTRPARDAFTDISATDMAGLRAASEPYALLLAQRTRARLGATWGLSETGAAGPTGNRYGDPAGHTCIAVAGPLDRAATLRTNSSDRHANMRAFAARALELLADALAGPAVRS